MNSDLFSCQFCKESFSSSREPLLLPDCGHSVCVECLKSKLSTGRQVTCKEDGILVTRTQLHDFPKNFALIQIIKSKPTRTIVYAEDHDSSSNSEKNCLSSTSVTKLGLAPSDNEQADQDRCLIHRKKLEILCVEDRVRICSSCALFGDHVNHPVIPVNVAIQEIQKRVDDVCELHRRIETQSVDVFEQSQYYNIIEQQYQNTLSTSLQHIEYVFEEMNRQLNNKRQELIKDTKLKMQKMEGQCYKHLQDLMSDVRRKVDLWKMTSKSKLDYFQDMTDRSLIPYDLIPQQSTTELSQLGEHILKELELTKVHLLQKVEDWHLKELTIEMRGDFENYLNACFSIVQVDQYNNQQKYMENSVSRLDSIAEYSLLKDINSSIMVDSLNQKQLDMYSLQYQQLQQQKLKSQQQQQQQQQQQVYQRQGSAISNHNIPTDTLQPVAQLSKSGSTSTLRKVSPSPIRRSAKSKKINEKFQPIIGKLRVDQLEQADFTSAELGDEGLFSLISIIVRSKNVKSIKLAKNKLQDSSVSQFLTELIQKQNDGESDNNQITTINLSSNMISDRIVDLLLDLCKQYAKSMNCQQLQQIYLNQNLINVSKVKKKVDEIKKYGVIVFI